MAPIANPPNYRTLIQHFFLHGSPRAGDRTVFGDGRPDSSGIVRGDEPLRGGGSVWLDGWSADTDHQTLHGSSWS